MDIEQIKPSLEIDENPRLHEKGWRLQPYVWSVIFLFIFAGLFGLFGTGILSNKELNEQDSGVKYENAMREGAISALEVQDYSGTVKTVIAIPVDYLSNFRMESVVPEPSETVFTGNTVNYFFEGSAKNKQIIFYLEPTRTGKVKADILVNSWSFHIENFIYP